MVGSFASSRAAGKTTRPALLSKNTESDQRHAINAGRCADAFIKPRAFLASALDGVCAATLRHGGAIACAPRLAAVQPHNASHAQSPTGC